MVIFQGVLSKNPPQTMRKKGKLITFFVISILIACLFWMFYEILDGRNGEGTVNTIEEIPYVGNALSDFKVSGQIKYVYSRSYIRPTRAVLFTAKTSYENIEEFFGSDVEPMYDIALSGWQGIFKSMAFDSCDFPIGDSKSDFVAYRDLSVNDCVLTIRLNYRTEDGSFTAYCISSVKGSD